jgi:hypothetical protein
LAHLAGAGAAGIFGAARDNHLELQRDHVEPLGHILADLVLEPAAARTGLVGDVDDDLFARQMRRQRAAIDLPLTHRGRLAGSRSAILLGCGFDRRQRLFHVLERERQLIGIEPFRAAAELMALQRLDDRRQPLRLIARRRKLLGMTCTLRQQQSPQRLRIGRERISRVHAVKCTTLQRACRTTNRA